MKPLLKQYLDKAILIAIPFFLLLLVITYSIPLQHLYLSVNIWKVAFSTPNSSVFDVFMGLGYGYVGLFFLSLILYVVVLIISIIEKKVSHRLLAVTVYFNCAFSIALFVPNFLFSGLFNAGIWTMEIFAFIINACILAAFVTYRVLNKEELSDEPFVISRVLTLIANAFGIVIFFICLFTSFLKINGQNYSASNMLKSNTPADLMMVGASLLILFFVTFIKFVTVMPHFLSKSYQKKSTQLNQLYLFAASAYFVIGFAYMFYSKVQGSYASTTSFVPLIFITCIYIFNSYIVGEVAKRSSDKNKEEFKRKFKWLPLVYVIIFTLISCSSIFFNLVEIEFSASYLDNTSFTGLDLLKDYKELDMVYQLMAFLLVTIIFTTSILLILSIAAFFGKSRNYYKIVKSSIYTNLCFMAFLSIIGLFFIFNSKLMQEQLNNLLDYYGVGSYDYGLSIKSQAVYLFFMSLVPFLILLIIGQLNFPNLSEYPDSRSNLSAKSSTIKDNNRVGNSGVDDLFDPCPTFSELDAKKEQYEQEYALREKNLFVNPTLPKLVNFIVEYARDSRLHLSYTHEDIAAFISGLGTSRLAILQGMSGTGKTSLPKIFAEALMANCDIVEVESSWRDKNELLGYYNEFSKKYTPKKFTEFLYRAKLNPDVPTLIVLDEMNLSRIEYYFSDFLSLMEHEEHKREIKLLNTKLFPPININEEYLALKNGHTLEISPNIWFIGTANRDESTFEISDKVYDRAQTMNFNRRAAKLTSYNEEKTPHFISYKMIKELFATARNKQEYDAEKDPIIIEVEKILAPYNISFGNRILRQMESFVKIYCECFLPTSVNPVDLQKNAVETILLSKVVSKLEFKQIDDKEKLLNAFEKLQLNKCCAFIRRLDGE